MTSRTAQRRNRPQPASATPAAPLAASGPVADASDPASGPTGRDVRVKALEELRVARGSDALIAYVTNTRPNYAASMAMDAVRRLAAHMPESKVKQLDLFLHTDGGESTTPWRLMTYLREYAESISVLVAHRAFSAGTLTALGADAVVMHPMAMLGPVDPTVHDIYGPRDETTGQLLGVGVEDVAAYLALVTEDFKLTESVEIVEAFRLLTEKVHPLTLGHVKRGQQQARMLGEKLLKSRNSPPSDPEIESLLEKLTQKLFFHGHPINRQEAEALNIPVERPSRAVEIAMWNVLELYEADLELQQAFDIVAEAIAAGAVVPKSPGPGTATKLPVQRRVVVESSAQTDVFTQELEVTLSRGEDGSILSTFASRGAAWSIES